MDNKKRTSSAPANVEPPCPSKSIESLPRGGSSFGGCGVQNEVVHHPNGSAHVPKSNSNSSKRVKACAIASTLKYNESSAIAKQKVNKREKQKCKKMKEHLLDASAPQESIRSDVMILIKGCTLFADGGNANNPPIAPTIGNNMPKPLKILQISKGDLHVPKEHLHQPSLGLTIWPEGSDNQTSNKPFILAPRLNALRSTAMHNREESSKSLCLALDAIEAAYKSSEGRGSSVKVVLEDGSKYCCVGSKAQRAARGVRTFHHAIETIGDHHQKRIFDYIRRVEQLFREWVDTATIRQVGHAIELVSASTFEVNNLGKTSMYNAFATAKNVYLNCHTDEDFTMGAVAVHTNEGYAMDDRVVAYFVFPLLSLAVPLRPGDQLFFDSREPHMLSSRCNNDDTLYCVSLYLKTNVIGLSDNQLPLSPQQEMYCNKYNERFNQFKKA